MNGPIISTKSILILCATFLGGWYLFGKDDSQQTELRSSPVSYRITMPDEESEEVGPMNKGEKLFVTSLQVNGEEYYIKFSNDTFLTHTSGVELRYFHHFILLEGIPFEIRTDYKPESEAMPLTISPFRN